MYHVCNQYYKHHHYHQYHHYRHEKQYPQYHDFDTVMIGLEAGLQKSFDAYASKFDEMQRDDDNMLQLLRVRDRAAGGLMHASNVVDCRTLREAASEAQELTKRKLLQGQPGGGQAWGSGILDRPFCWARAFVDPGIKGAARIEDKVEDLSCVSKSFFVTPRFDRTSRALLFHSPETVDTDTADRIYTA